jgi:hypothetical protein
MTVQRARRRGCSSAKAIVAALRSIKMVLVC